MRISDWSSDVCSSDLDTAYAFHGGQWRDIDDILAEVAKHGVRHVCVTGGESLSQKRCIGLLQRLCDAGYAVSLETDRTGLVSGQGVSVRVDIGGLLIITKTTTSADQPHKQDNS